MEQSVYGVFEQMKSRRMDEEVSGTGSKKTGTSGDTGDGFLTEEELDEATKKVIRDGKVAIVKKRVGPHHLTSAQKAALAKARKKAHTGMAEKSRQKSMKKRASAGLNDEEMITCPECGFEGVLEDFDEEDGILYCPECGAECGEAPSDEGCNKNEEVDIADLAFRLDECGGSDYMRSALKNGKYSLVQKYLEIKED